MSSTTGPADASGGRKTAFNIGGAVIGILLALIAIFALVWAQGNIAQPQKYSAQINYDQ